MLFAHTIYVFRFHFAAFVLELALLCSLATPSGIYSQFQPT